MSHLETSPESRSELSAVRSETRLAICGVCKQTSRIESLSFDLREACEPSSMAIYFQRRSSTSSQQINRKLESTNSSPMRPTFLELLSNCNGGGAEVEGPSEEVRLALARIISRTRIVFNGHRLGDEPSTQVTKNLDN